jgi:hypothetical protein
MGCRIERILYVALLLLCYTTGFSQPYKKLTVDDFRGVPFSITGKEIALTNCSIEYSYSVAKRESNYYILSFHIKLIMDNNASWMDRSRVNTPAMLAEILKHEQGHYNIAYMEQQELLRTVAHTVFHENYQQVANNIFDRIEAKYKQLNLDYDADTQNSTNRVQQHSWDTYFDQKLAYMPPDNEGR